MAISYRRSTTKSSDSSGTSIAGIYASNDAGDLGWFGVGWLDTAGTTDVTGVSDTVGNIWVATPTGKIRNASQQYSMRMYYVAGPLKAAGANTVTVTLNAAATFKRLSLLEYKSSNGAWTSSPLDKSNGSTGNGTAMSSGNMTPTVIDELVAGFAAITGSGTVHATAPYVTRAVSSDGAHGGVERILSGGAGVAVAAQAYSIDPAFWTMLGATFTDTPLVVSTTTAEAVLAVASHVSARGRGRALMSGG